MKHLKSYFIIAGILIGIIVVVQFLPSGRSRVVDLLQFNNRNSLKALSEFQIRDTASINKIFMVDKQNRAITLQRKGNNWTVISENQEYPARMDAIKLLLHTLNTMRVKMPVAMSAQEEILRKMAGRSIKVEIYSPKRHIKTFFVGGVTQDNLGTYMLLEGADVPFVVEIPGFRGFIASRFSTDILNWRSNILIGEPHETIKKVEISYPNNPKAGFNIIQIKPKQYKLFDSNGTPAIKFDSLAVKGFMEQFDIAHFDRFVTLKTDHERDSVLKSTPMIIIKLVDKRDSLQTYTFYQIPEINEATSPGASFYPQSMWAFNNTGDWVIIQTYTYLLMFRHLSDFQPIFN